VQDKQQPKLKGADERSKVQHEAVSLEMLFTDIFIFEITRQSIFGDALNVARERVLKGVCADVAGGGVLATCVVFLFRCRYAM
jgi:hypothetical protein